MSALNRAYVILGYSALFGLGLLDTARGPFFPDITTDLGLSDTQAALFFATASTVMILSGRLVPGLADKLGLVNAIRLGLILMGTGFFAISFVHNLLTMLIACATFGFGFGIINVGQNLLIVEGSPPKLRRRLLSGLHSVYALSSLAAPVIAAWFFRIEMNWRQAFRWYALCVIVGIVASLFAREKKHQDVQTSPAGKMNPSEKRQYLLMALALSFYVNAELTISTRLALYLRRAYEYSPEKASEYLAGFFLLLFIGRIVFTTFSFARFSSHGIMQISFITAIISFILGLTVSPLFIVVCGLAMAPVFGVALDFLAERFPNASREAISYSLAISAVFIVMMHFTVGALTESYGIEKAIYFGPFNLLCGCIVLWRLTWLEARRA